MAKNKPEPKKRVCPECHGTGTASKIVIEKDRKGKPTSVRKRIRCPYHC